MTLPRQEWNKIRDHDYRISKVRPKFSFPVMVGLAQMWSWFLKADIVSVQHKHLNSINLFGPYDIQVIQDPSISFLCGSRTFVLEGRCEMLRVQVYKSKWLFWGFMKCIRKPVFCKDYRAWTPLLSFFRCLSCLEVLRLALSAIEWTESTVLGYEFRIVTR